MMRIKKLLKRLFCAIDIHLWVKQGWSEIFQAVDYKCDWCECSKKVKP